MRAILIDWLVEVAEEYRLVPETLHLAVNYIDRFLSYVPVARSKLQLVGVAAERNRRGAVNKGSCGCQGP